MGAHGVNDPHCASFDGRIVAPSADRPASRQAMSIAPAPASACSFPKRCEPGALSMSYEVLVAIVAINAIMTLSLWRMMATKADRPGGLNKKAAKALWHSDPIVPRHNPPIPGGGYSSLHSDEDKAFFFDFQEFADVTNRWLATPDSRFRLQELPDDHLRLNVPDDQPVFGRSFAIYYNQSPVGRLELCPSYRGYTSETSEVSTSV